MPYDCIDLNLRHGRIPYFDLVQKRAERMKFRKKLNQFNNYLRTYGLNLKSVEIDDNVENEEGFKLQISEKADDLNLAALCQKARDSANISEKSYKELRKKLLPLCRLVNLSKCNKYKSQLNNIWPVDNNSMGSYILDPVQKIKFVCNNFLNRLKSEQYDLKINKFNILLCGDGIQLSKTHINVINFCFSLIDEKLLNIDQKKLFEQMNKKQKKMNKREKQKFEKNNNIGLYTLGKLKFKLFISSIRIHVSIQIYIISLTH